MFVMSLLAFLRGLDQSGREHFAVQVGTTVGHMNNVAYRTRKASAALAMQIEIESGQAVCRWHLRPADWHLIWPELVGTPGAPAVTPAEHETHA